MGTYISLFDTEADALINLLESDSSAVGSDDLTTTSASTWSFAGDIACVGDFAPSPEEVPIPFNISFSTLT